jgi:hypothetical protein
MNLRKKNASAWSQDDLDAMLEIVDALADVINHMERSNRTQSIHERARALYLRKSGKSE